MARDRGPRLAALAFAVGLAVAFVLLMRLGPRQWFFLDEWDFLAGRTVGSVDDLLEPHNGHWSTLPILVYRAVFRVFGLLHYAPYRALAVGSHLVAAVMMRGLLRRLGVGPWLANAVLVPWVLFGAGFQNIVWGFQVAWNACLVAAVGQLLLADHDGPPNRRDAGALVLGLAGLMSAGIYVPLLGAVTLALVLRRGWRSALLQAGPLLAVYGWWIVAYGGDNGVEPLPDGRKVEFVWTGVTSAVSAFWWAGAVAAVAVAAAVGVLVAWARRLAPAERRRELAVPIGLGSGAVAYMYVVASGRANFGIEMASSSRYLHVIMFLLLPAIGLAASLVARRLADLEGWRRAAGTGLALVVLWFGIPGNLSELVARDETRAVVSGNPSSVQAMAWAVVDREEVPAEANPFGASTPRLTVGWLRDAVASGDLRAVQATTFFTAASVEKSLKLLQIDEPLPDGASCRPVVPGDVIELQAGERVRFGGKEVDGQVVTAAGVAYERELLLSVGRTVLAMEDLRLEVTRVEEATRCS